MAETDLRDRMEPPGVATGRLALAALLIFVLLGLTFAGVTPLAGRLRKATSGEARAFPAPQLETTTEPRSTADRDHGPKPYRERPASARTGQPDPVEPALAQAMAATVARGADAYAPAAAGARR